MNALEFFNAVSSAAEIPCHRGFWDIARCGKKPDTFFVWRLNGAQTQVNSDDGEEHFSRTYAVSVFTKSDDLESVCEAVETAAETIGAEVRRVDFEDYEKDTGYFHGEITVTRCF